MAEDRAARWDGFPDEIAPTAPRTGPFARGPFLRTVWNHLHGPDEDLAIAVTDDGAVAAAISDSGISLVGPEHVTDYHSPLGADPGGAVERLMEVGVGTRFSFDSLPDEAVIPIVASLTQLGIAHRVFEHEACAVLELPASFDDWLMGVGKKERHEIRRKRRRFEAAYGKADFVVAGVDALEMFVSMHRRQPGDKGEFMTPTMEAFFSDLMTGVGAVIHTLTCDGRVLAAAFGFETEDGYFYYNSAFEPDAASESPGVVLLAALIEAQIERGATVFDFLKGDESYKYRHGATRRPLYTVEGRTP